MKKLNVSNNNRKTPLLHNIYLATAAIFTLAIIFASATIILVSASTTGNDTTTPSSGLELLAQPVYQEVSRQAGENLINDTLVETTFVANGTLTLPNITEPISTTSTGSILISLVDSTVIGKQVITTEDGSESATAKFFGIARFNMEEGAGRGIVIALVQTNSTTGMLAPLDGMILAGQGEFSPEGTSRTTLWEWQSGIPQLLPTGTTTTPIPEIELSPQPVYQDWIRAVSETLINQTHTLSTVSGNGTLTLANGTETIRTTSRGNLMVFDKFIRPMKETTTAIATAEQIVITADGSESATARFYEIARFNLQDYTGKGITIAAVHTNSTGMLAPLDGMILVGQEEFRADGSRLVTMWEWQSGIPQLLPTGTTTSKSTES
jgi:hypothetical protein